MSVPGLVATCFEGDRAGNAVKELEDIFAEKEGNGRSSRVGVLENPRHG